MKSLESCFLFIVTLIFFTYCSAKKNNIDNKTISYQKEFIIYGSRNCPHCIKLIQSLDSAGVKYNFKDVEKDQALFNELYQKIQKVNFKGYVTYPVIDINGKILVNPTLRELFRSLIS